MAQSAPIAPVNPAQMNPGQTDPLAALRDIHLPGAVEIWPPAVGWWLLLAMVILFTAYILYRLFLRFRANRYRREAIAELKQLRAEYQRHGEDAVYLAAFQALLKRVALTRFNRESVAHLTGESWVAFLDRTARSQEFSMGKGQILIDGNYTSEPVADVAALHALGTHWIKHHREELAA